MTIYAYDALRRLTTETWYQNAADADAAENETNVIHYTYDAAGRLVSESDNCSSNSYTYEVLERVTTESETGPQLVLWILVA